jgi:TolA-binding protein
MKARVMTGQGARQGLAAFGVAALLATTAPAGWAQDVSSREGIALQNQILALRQEVEQAQSSRGGDGSAPAAASSGGSSGDLVSQLLERVSLLEQQQRDMRGEIDQLTNDLQQKTAALAKQIADNQFAAQNGAGGAAAGAAAPASAAASAAPAESASTTPDELLKAGKAALVKKDYDTAHDDAQAALHNAKGAFKVDAQFLLAQSLAGQKQYRQSALAYYEAYSLSPKSTRAPDALLGVTATLLALGDKKAACQALSKLHAEFPDPAKRVSNAADIYAQRGGCG